MNEESKEQEAIRGHAEWHGGRSGTPHNLRDHKHGHFHGRGWHGSFGGGGGGHWRGRFGGRHGGGWGGHHGGWGSFGHGGRERLERGMLRYVILDLLRDGPKHGYEIIKHLEERTGGRYSPSPGTLYPTLQLMEDQGLVKSAHEDGRRVYHLTDAGRAELADNSNSTDDFWSRFPQHPLSGPLLYEITFLKDALNDLNRTISGVIRTSVVARDAETVRLVRQTLERCQNEVREIIAQGAPAQSMSVDPDAPDPSDNGLSETRRF